MRLQKEARVLASLNHPNIATIYEEIELPKGTHYLVLEYVQGLTLAERITEKLSIVESLEICLQIADALVAAHEKAIVHLDLKPENVKISDQGHVKVLDFGLARIMGSRTRTGELDGRTNRVAGTPAYMSPEQIRGRDVDHRSDIWSFGCLLYEMLCGNAPFQSDSTTEVLTSTLIAAPDLEKLPDKTMPVVRHIIGKCLSREPDLRYQSAAELHHDLENYLSTLRASAINIKAMLRFVRKPRIAALLVVVLLAVCVGAFWIFNRNAKNRWARNEAVPEITIRMERGDYFDALAMALKAQHYIPDDPMLKAIWTGISRNCSINSTPKGADVFLAKYTSVDAGWQHLGRTPVDKVRIPFGICRWKIVKKGFETVTIVQANLPAAPWGKPDAKPEDNFDFVLNKQGALPGGMTLIPESQVKPRLSNLDFFESVFIPSYFVDKYEVTNQQFMEFVEQGGYEKNRYWETLNFVKEGVNVSWEKAVARFIDSTGRLSPATWADGTYPTGRADYPVCGVNWFEAAAYAKWKDANLPTVYHWVKASIADDDPSHITRLSNFGEAPAAVGSHLGMGQFGLYDAAGNVREWCLNAPADSNEFRYILGGAWGDPTYAFVGAEVRSPWDRSHANGFRCVKYIKDNPEINEVAFGPIARNLRDFSDFVPANDQDFRSYIENLYRYDRTDLRAVVESTDESSEHWRKEKVTFDAAYSNERVTAYLLLPKTVDPPYQTVVFFPGAGVLNQYSSEKLRYESVFSIIVESGRAVIYPIYKGTYERRAENITKNRWNIEDTIVFRDWIIQLSKDLRRSIDYLHSRQDIDTQRLGYFGLSWGAATGPIMIATEERFKVAVLLCGGLFPRKRLGAADIGNFAMRVKIPVLMVNGRHDCFFPLDSSQKPLFNLLATGDQEKKHVVYPGGHFVTWENREISTKKILDWLDRYLGPVNPRP